MNWAKKTKKDIMKIYTTILLLISCHFLIGQKEISIDDLLTTTKQEIGRHKAELVSNTGMRPYYLSAAIIKTSNISYIYDMGEFIVDSSHYYTLQAESKVGDYIMDNSNIPLFYFDYRSNHEAKQYYDIGSMFYDIEHLRISLWYNLNETFVAACQAYKEKLELKNMGTLKNTLADNIKLNARKYRDSVCTEEIPNKVDFEKYFEVLDGQMKSRYKDTFEFSYTFSFEQETFLFHDTEESEIVECRRPFMVLYITGAPPGIYDSDEDQEYIMSKHVLQNLKLPLIEELQLEQVSRIIKKNKPQKMISNYFGCVLIEDEAVGALLHNSIEQGGVYFGMKKETEEKTGHSYSTGEIAKDKLLKKIGFNYFTKDLDVTAYSSIGEVNGLKVARPFKYDFKGVKSVDSVVLIKNGRVKSLLNSREEFEFQKQALGYASNTSDYFTRATNHRPACYNFNFKNKVTKDELYKTFYEAIAEQPTKKGYIIKRFGQGRRNGKTPSFECKELYEVDPITKKQTLISNANLEAVSDVAFLQLIGSGGEKQILHNEIDEYEKIFTSYITPPSILILEASIIMNNDIEQKIYPKIIPPLK
jgi:hypothetical protein